jgi:hypothetical protein
MALSAERAAQQASLDLFEVNAQELLRRLRAEAERVHSAERRPVSINDLAALYGSLCYRGNPSVLGAVFRAPHWQLVGYEPAVGKGKHARRVGQWVRAVAR